MFERLDPNDFPDSPYAQELRSGVPRLRFSAALEPLYRRSHLQRMRLRVRLWFSFAALVATADIVLRLVGFDRHDPLVWAYGIANACDLCLVSLAWSGGYQKLYLPVARVLVPLLGAATALFTARALVIGQGQQLAVLTLSVIVAFFFSGLLFRDALFATLVSVASFAAALTGFGTWNMTAVTSLTILLVTATICVIGYRDIERSYRRAFLENALIGELVTRDDLSGLMNRRAFYGHLQRVWQQAQREHAALAVLMVDIDHFKTYNDSYGHQAGDAALRSVAQLLKGFARRPLDLAARYGGDEFVAVLYGRLPGSQVQELATRLRQAVEDYFTQQQLAVTVSIGIGVVVPAPERTPHGAVQLADEALYEAKLAGRNRVVVKHGEEYHQLDTGSFRQSASA